MSRTLHTHFTVEPHLFTKASLIAGTGLFTNRSIHTGATAFVMKGTLIHFTPKTKQETMATPDLVGIGPGLYLDPAPPYRFINHSCDPNVVASTDGITYVALKDIQAGEELTFDYSTSEESDWEMPCTCGTRHCRRLIESIHTLPYEAFLRYQPHIPAHFHQLFLNHHATRPTPHDINSPAK